MTDFIQKEYQAVILGALLHVGKLRFIGDVGKEE
jgi:hypothetical protein